MPNVYPAPDQASTLRACFLLSTRGFAYGGLETVADHLAAGLEQRGVGVSFVAGVAPGRPARPDLPPVGRVVRVPVVASTSGLARLAGRLTGLPALHAQSASFVAACLAHPAARRAVLTADLMVTLLEGESVLVSRLLGRSGRRTVAYLAGAIDLRWARADRSWLRIATSHTLAAVYREHGLRCDGVVTPGISADLLRGAPARSPGGIRLVYVGRLEPNKRVDWLLEVLPRVPEATLRLIGDGPARGAIWSAAAARGLTERVEVVGPLPPVGVIAELRQADVFVFPSAYESFGTAALEALAVGLPVVATDLPALREATGGHADLVPADDLGAWVAAVARLLDDPALRAERAEAGRAWAAGFTWERVVDTFWAMLEARWRSTHDSSTSTPGPRS